MGTHTHTHFHGCNKTEILSALRETEARIMSKFDDESAALDTLIADANQVLANQVAQAKDSASVIADLQVQLAAALAASGPNDAAVQSLLDRTNAEVAKLQTALTPVSSQGFTPPPLVPAAAPASFSAPQNTTANPLLGTADPFNANQATTPANPNPLPNVPTNQPL